MKKTINGEIVEVVIDYFNEDENRWYVDCFWIVPNINDDKEYEVDETYERRRGTTMAYIDNKGNVEYNPIFKSFTTKDETIQETITDFILQLMK